MNQLLIKNIHTLVQTETSPRSFVQGKDMQNLPCIENAWLLMEGEKIKDFGTMATCPSSSDQIIDAKDGMVFPTWCDSHTHLVFAGSREKEFVDRINGLTYEEIAARGGGILNSAARLQNTSEEQLFQDALKRLKEVSAFGTGLIEIKSGYGLNIESELKMLRVIKRLQTHSDVEIKATFLGAHAFPIEYKNNHSEYIQLIIEEMLPKIEKENLASYCDAFCEKGFFSVEETEQIIKAAAQYGLKAKIHTNQFNCMGGIEMSVKYDAVSVDHLEVVNDKEIECLLNSNTIPTLLPSAPFFINDHYPPARKMIDSGLGIALASDYNPGSTPSGRMAFVLSLACIKLRMSPEEAINAITINGAYALESQDQFGSIAKGKTASVFITQPIPSIAYLPYSFGSDLIETVILKGKIQ